jgi:CRISPR/Cas system CSM-associated protein Csm3 (group 7 of RAMP superfamily)
MNKISLKFIIETLSDFHIGTGFSIEGYCDDAQFKDEDGYPSIKTETFKGLLKQSCNEIINLEWFKDYEDIYKYIFDYKAASSIDLTIDVDKNNAKNLNKLTTLYNFTAINNNGVAKKGSLRSIECGVQGINFECELNFYYFEELIKTNKIIELLKLGLENITLIGGSRRRGLGEVKIIITDDSTPKIESSNIEINNDEKKIGIIFELQDNATIAKASQTGNHLDTLDYIPGSMMLGALRNKMNLMNIDKDYLDDKNIESCSFFYPFPKYFDNKTPIVFPIPLSFRKNKNSKIFETYKDTINKKSLPHWLFEQNKAEENNLANIISQCALNIQKNSNDKSFKGGYICFHGNNIEDISLDKCEYFKVKKTANMRNRIYENSQSTNKNALFSQEQILKGTNFYGEIKFKTSEHLISFMHDFSKFLNKDFNLHIGRGAKPIKIINYFFINDDNKKDIKLNYDNSFIIYLLSDAILFDEKLNHKAEIDINFISEETGIDKSKFKLVTSVFSNEIKYSFNGNSGLRKFSNLVISKGSVFKFQYCNKDESEKNQLINWLKKISVEGIGFRKNEGFGKVFINNKLHEEINKQKNNKPEEINEIPLSEISTNDQTKNILEKNYKLSKEAAQIKLNLSKSLLGSLFSLFDSKIDRESLNDFIEHNLSKNTLNNDIKTFYESLKNDIEKTNEDNFDTLLEKYKLAFLISLKDKKGEK